MGSHMKTTVEISDPLLREAKGVAERDGTTLRELIELGLRRVLDERAAAPRKPYKMRDLRNWNARLAPGIREGDWARIREIANDRFADGEDDE
jgi:hypothetical protein